MDYTRSCLGLPNLMYPSAQTHEGALRRIGVVVDQPVHAAGRVARMENIMLYDFLGANRSELIERCRVRVSSRRAPRATPGEITHGIPIFLDQLILMFPKNASNEDASTRGQ